MLERGRQLPTNVIERLDCEVNRRCGVAGILPNAASAPQLSFTEEPSEESHLIKGQQMHLLRERSVHQDHHDPATAMAAIRECKMHSGAVSG